MVVTTVFLCTSNAAQRSWITCIDSLLFWFLLSASMISVRCGKTDNFPPRARPLRVATFCSSGRTWVGFLVGLIVPAASDLCLLVISLFYPIFIFFSGSQSHQASLDELGLVSALREHDDQ